MGSANYLPDNNLFPISFSNADLRAAIRSNSVTFPSQTVLLKSHADADLHWRIVHLYFVSGWPVRRICVRYRLCKPAVYVVLNEWRRRAIAAGFVQEIDPDNQPAGSVQRASSID
jgi:Homeodomain-like domain